MLLKISNQILDIIYNNNVYSFLVYLLSYKICSVDKKVTEPYVILIF